MDLPFCEVSALLLAYKNYYSVLASSLSNFCVSFSCEAVREQVEELLKLQTEWDSFLEGVDRSLQTADSQEAEHLSPATELCDGRTGKSMTLGDYMDEGQKLLLVLIRHFG